MLAIIASLSGIIGFILYIVEKLYGPKKLKDVLIWGGLGLMVTIIAWKLYINIVWVVIAKISMVNIAGLATWVHWSIFGALYTSVALGILKNGLEKKKIKDRIIRSKRSKYTIHLAHALIGMFIWLGIYYIFSNVAVELVRESRTQIQAATFISGFGGMVLGIYIGLHKRPKLKAKPWKFF